MCDAAFSADQDDREARRGMSGGDKGSNVGAHFVGDALSDRFPVENSCRHVQESEVRDQMHRVLH
jgi:hypothetical protein